MMSVCVGFRQREIADPVCSMAITIRCRASRRTIARSTKSILNLEDISRYPLLNGQNHVSLGTILTFVFEIHKSNFMESKQLKQLLELSLDPSPQEKLSFIDGDAIYPLPIMPMRKTLGQHCGTNSSATLGSLLAIMRKKEPCQRCVVKSFYFQFSSVRRSSPQCIFPSVCERPLTWSGLFLCTSC